MAASDKHQDQEFSEVKWGMKVIEFNKSAFERQIREAVTIEKEAQNHTILNSKSEWNQSSVPRLATRTGNHEIWQMEAELRKEKEREEEYERKIRELRKERNKRRLQKDYQNQPNKRLKTGEEGKEYVSIRKVWGPPPTSAPGKKKNR